MVIFTANDEALDSKSLIRVTSKSKNFNCVNIHEKGEREKKKAKENQGSIIFQLECSV